MDRRKVLQGLAATAVISGVGVAAAREKLVVSSFHRVELPSLRGLRVVHLTDLHMGWSSDTTVTETALSTTRRMAPDLVVLTGDYVNHTLRYVEQLRSFLKRLPHPCVATLGNHDHWSGAPTIRSTLRSCGITVLDNAWCEVSAGRATVTVVGVDDGHTNHANLDAAFRGLRRPEAAIGLSHFPNEADDMIARGVPLVLAGHTHGGQVEVPLLTPLVSRATGNRYLAGWYRVGDGRLYVNVGLGTGVTPWRIGRGVAPEVACFDFV